MRHLNNPAAIEAWDEAYALLHKKPRIITVPRTYWLAALPAVALCVLLLVACPNVGG